MDQYQTFIHASRYARWDDGKKRRETWEETVDRYVSFFSERYPAEYPTDLIKQAILSMDCMPSMRALMTAGKALSRDEIAGYNCSYAAVDHPKVFDEILYILMCGTGVGFSVERQYVTKLPSVPEKLYPTDTVIGVHDSKIGWAKSLRELITLLYSGHIPKWDVSKVRPKGSRLKTFGGRSSGPEPLIDLFQFTVRLFTAAQGRKLNSIECHDLVCKIADIVVVGGVRRSALISLSNLSDERMRTAKSGQWWVDEPQRALANNSVAYTEKPEVGTFLKEWTALYESKSGERGLFNRVAATRKARSTGRRDTDYEYGVNPCGEIVLRSHGLCNLSEVVVRSGDSVSDLKQKVEIATIIGTFQSTLTNFRYVRPIWKNNAEEERLLGVSLTGIMDHSVLSGFWQYVQSGTGHLPQNLAEVLDELKQHAIQTNKVWAERLGINPSTAITTVKPSGTVSQLVDSASGIHPRFSRYYVRTVRSDNKDPLAQLMIHAGIPCEADVMKPDTGLVFSFPHKAPTSSVLVKDLTAIEQLEHYKIFQEHWCEHNPSITVYVGEDEWFDVGAWVYKNFDNLGGVSFLPRSDHTYRQAPYQEIDKETYLKLVAALPEIPWEDLPDYEKEDMTENVKQLACSTGVCEL